MKRRIAIRAWRYRLAVVLLCVSVVLLASAKPCAADFFTAGSVRYAVCDDGLDTEEFFDEIPGAEGRTDVSLEADYAFPCGNNAAARASADLASGSLLTYAWAQYTDPNPYWHTTGEARSRLREGLLFELAPGHYEDGAVVTVSGYLTGSLHSIGPYPGTHATVTCQASFHGRDFEFSSSENSLVSEPFALTAPLITPGSTLTETLEIPSVVYASLVTEAQVKPTEVSSARCDFGGTFRFTEVEAPQGVGWTSESGLFLTIPEPSTWVLLGTAAIVLLACGWRREW